MEIKTETTHVRNIADEIQYLAELRHSLRCARPDRCKDGWHVQNDYLARAATDVITEYRSALTELEKSYRRG